MNRTSANTLFPKSIDQFYHLLRLSKVIDKIINHLKLTFKAERPPPQRKLNEPGLFIKNVDYKIEVTF